MAVPLTQNKRIGHEADRFSFPGLGKVLSKYVRRFFAASLLVVVGFLVLVQLHPAKTSAAPLVCLQSITIEPAHATTGTLTFSAALPLESYSVELILPNNASPVDYGISFHEAREHLRVIVRQDDHEQPLTVAPDVATASQLSDELDSHAGVKLCEFRPSHPGGTSVECRLTNDLPWPDNVQIAISQAGPGAPRTSQSRLGNAVQPYSFGFSAILACTSVFLFWRPTSS